MANSTLTNTSRTHGHGRRAQMRRSYMNRDHVSTYDYDARGMLQHISHHTPDTSLINYFEYHYDRAGRRTSMATRDNDALYTYDDLDRLTGADYSNFWKVGVRGEG